jgi:dipeptidyl aminopeptidase/acylaminoacyl peptidase
MNKIILFSVLILAGSANLFAQKKQLDHTVYDGWQRIGERSISDDGKWIVYSADVQEGDNELYLVSSDGKYSKRLPRGYDATFSSDNKYLAFRIKPIYLEAKEAKNKKKKPEDQPKDSLACLLLGTDSCWKAPKVKSYKVPEQESGYLVYWKEKANGKSDDKADGTNDSGSDLLVRNLATGTEKTFSNVTEYELSKKGLNLVIEQAKDPKDSLSAVRVSLVNLSTQRVILLCKGGNEFKSFTFSDNGTQLAFIAERMARPKELQKYYQLYLYQPGLDSAKLLVDRHTAGMRLGTTVSEFSNLKFSKSGNRIYFGVAPIQPAKDTSLIESETAKLDIWHYNDDYLQTQQLYNLTRDLQKNYLSVYFLDKNTIKNLGSASIPNVYTSEDGDGAWAIGISDVGHRVESQWTGNTLKDIYLIGVSSDSLSVIKKNVDGDVGPFAISPSATKMVWYDNKAKNYVAWNGKTVSVISKGIKFPLFDEEYDQPSDPNPYGFVGFEKGDSSVLIYDRYDMWRVFIASNKAPINVTKIGRPAKNSYRYLKLNKDEHYIGEDSLVAFRYQQEINKDAGIVVGNWSGGLVKFGNKQQGAYVFGSPTKAEKSSQLIFTKESYQQSPNLYSWNPSVGADQQISSINKQQADYNWGTASLYYWKDLNGKPAQGIIYKPEDFDPAKKYPLILYFYETHTNTLNGYIPPSPTGSRLNISFFVSRGYIVFSPDIHYTIGHPAKSCYNYVVSAAKSLSAQKWIDGKNIGIQGQSWGGIQVAQLVTMTSMFKAAWAGAPVANMTSAYGGIRWESGVNRQFQYEHTQSRIGATLWQKPELYIENSPLFHVPKITTPLVIMANDADGAVPWYQGIELFTAMRRMDKKVWMLTYNGEAHNLRERRNQKDISIREQQYFDWLLKGAKPPRWIVEGVPAVKKGKEWGLELVN